MFGWFKSDYRKREEADNCFFKLHIDNERLERENKLLRRELDRLECEMLRSENKRMERNFEQGGVIHAMSEGFVFEPFIKKTTNLLEIKLKDTVSVPEVWYEGKRLDEMPNGLVSIDYNWKTKGHDDCENGENNLDVEWFGTHKEGFRR